MSFSWAVTDNTKRPSAKPDTFRGYFTDIQRAARRSLPKRPDKDLCRLLGLALVPAADESERARPINEQVQQGDPVKGPDVEGVEKGGEKVIGKDRNQEGPGVKSNKRTFAETILSKLPCVDQEKECSDRERMISSFAVYLAIVIFVLLIILVILAATISALSKNNDDSPNVLSGGHSSIPTSSTISLTLSTTSPTSSTLTKSYSKSTSVSTLMSKLTSFVASKATTISVSSGVQTKVTTPSSVTFLTSDTSTRLYLSTGAKTPTISSSTTRSSISSARSTAPTIFSTSSAKSSRSSISSTTSPAESVKSSSSSKTSSSASSFPTTMSAPGTRMSSSTVNPITSSTVSFTRSSTSTSIYSSKAVSSPSERTVTSSASSLTSTRRLTDTTKSSTLSIPLSSPATLTSSSTSSTTSSAPLPLFETSRITCTSPACLAAGKTLGRVDFGTSPCSDFYEFSCGGWINATADQLADTNQRNVPVTLRDEMRSGLLKQLQVLLQAVYYETDSLKVRISRRLYQACQESNFNGDTDLGEDQLRESMEELRELVRGFGVSAGGEIHSTLDKSLNVALNTFQITPFFKMATIIMDDRNNGKVYGIQLSPPTMYLDTESYRGAIKNNNAAQMYITRVSEVLFIFLSSFNNGGSIPGVPNTGRMKRQDGGLSYEEVYFKVLDSFGVDVNISQIIERTSSADSNRENQHKVIQFSDLKGLYPNINWDATMGAIPSHALVHVENPDYFEAFNANLPNLNEENVKLFVFLSVLVQRAWPYMPYPLRNMIRDIRKDNSPIYSALDCVEKTIELAPEETHALYVAQYTQQVLEKRLKIADLENTVSQVFKTLLAQTTWVANDLELVVSVFLANVNLVFSPVRSYIRETEGIASARQSLLSLAVELHRQKQGYEEFLVTKAVDENNYIRDWTSTYLSYEASLNIIAIPTGIVTFLTNDQQPHFDLHGNVGTMLAEQIIKVLIGEMKDGAVPKWWGDDNSNRFGPTQECYKTQLTEAQQVDVGNVIIANGAFQLIDKVFRRNTPLHQTLIEDSAFTEEMLFYINTVQLECSADAVENKLRKIRMNNMISNSERFSSIFSCPKHSPMVSSPQCYFFF